MPKQFTIVGAGMGGPLLALLLARQGHHVAVYEQRPDLRHHFVPSHLSFNMTLTLRGIQALTTAGVVDQVMHGAMPLMGRMMHDQAGQKRFQPYGKNQREIIYAIQRGQLNAVLLDAAEAHERIRLHFNTKCLGIDKAQGKAYFCDRQTKHEYTAQADVIVGADGAFSIVRQAMQHKEAANYSQRFSEWGYKELCMPPRTNGEACLENDVFHLWPRGDFMLMAVPNCDQSFTVTCILPFRGETSFAALQTAAQVHSFFEQFFLSACPALPKNFAQTFLHHPTGRFLTTYVEPWYYQDKVVLVGDACHSFLPFYGQGMNATFQDCLHLAQHMARSEDDLEEAFKKYQAERKPNTDTMARLSEENFTEIRDKVKSPLFLLRKRLDIQLNKLFPNAWQPLYTMIMHTMMPYTTAVQRHRRQEKILQWLSYATGVAFVFLFWQTVIMWRAKRV